ncbi:MAG: hypothetical protein KAR05_01235 [Candidatus Omnitrophica bacterium]|nr:hypothetical protein [Candidatus Omnitrophota bacterium]
MDNIRLFGQSYIMAFRAQSTLFSFNVIRLGRKSSPETMSRMVMAKNVI